MTCGDTEGIIVNLIGYTPQAGDTVEFTVRRKIGNAPVIYKKAEFAETQAVVRIEPEDTERLRFGDYIYDVQLTYGGKVKTIITPSKLIVTNAHWYTTSPSIRPCGNYKVNGVVLDGSGSSQCYDGRRTSAATGAPYTRICCCGSRTRVARAETTRTSI